MFARLYLHIPSRTTRLTHQTIGAMSIQTDNIEKLPASADKESTTNMKESMLTIGRTPSKLQKRRSIFRSSKTNGPIEEPKNSAQDWPNAIGVGVSE